MKNIIQRSTLLIGIMAVFSCSGDLLDPKEDQYLTKERIGELKDESPEAVVKLINGSLNGIYNSSIDVMRDGHDTFGFKAILLAGDLTGMDMVQEKHHFFGHDYNINNRDANFVRPSIMWDYYYKQVSSANIILNDFLSGEIKEESFINKKAETLTIRGIAYYYLINLFQQNVKGNENAPGVPLPLTPQDENLPRASVQKVYDRIIADLRYGVENNVVTPEIKDADKAVAAAYLAKAYAAKQNWDSTAYFAKIASDAKPFTSKDIVESSKWEVSNPSWLWGYDVTSETSTIYASFYSHIDNTIPGYTSIGIYKSIYNNLYDKISDTDVRKKLYINKDLFPQIAAKYSELPKYANIKYITPKDFTGDYCYLRKEDPFLLLVEAKVELNQLAEAKNLLSEFMALRDPSYDVSKFSTQEELRQEVRIQRRIELWGEGTSFYDLKRWGLPINRGVEGSSNHRTILEVPVGDKRWVYQIPQSEIDSNHNIGEQNP